MTDISLLAWIWIISCGLAAAAVALMLLLILKRVVSSFYAARDLRRRAVLEGLLIDALDDPAALDKLPLSTHDRLILGDIAIDFATSIRGDTQQMLVDVMDRLQIEQIYTDSVTSADAEIREKAVRGLSLFDSDLSFDALWRALKDPSPAIRLSAARKIVDSERAFEAQAFIEMLEIGTVVRSRELRPIVAKLAKRDPDGVFKALSATSNADRRLFLIYALGRSGRFDFADDLMPMTMSDNPNERAETIRALGSLGNPDAKVAVMMALEDRAWEVRAQAAQAAGDIGLKMAIPHLAGLLSEKEWWVRYRAAWALWNLGDEGRARLTPGNLASKRAANIAKLVLAEATEKVT